MKVTVLEEFRKEWQYAKKVRDASFLKYWPRRVLFELVFHYL